jgi:hypothetical protein
MRALLFFFLISHSYTWSIIKELPSLSELEQYVNNETLLLFDIDNTLMRPKQMLGSDEWFTFYLNKKIAEYNDRQKALKEALSLWGAIQTVTSVQYVEPCTQTVIESLRKKNISIMVLTQRKQNFATLSIQQLRSLQLDFSKTAPVKTFFELKEMPLVKYEEGALFCDEYHKGESFLCFLRQNALHPKRVVFVDDKRFQLEQLNVLESEGIEYFGLRYGGADVYVREFDPAVTEQQLASFMSILPDDEAKKGASRAA